MTIEQIEKFFSANKNSDAVIRISFKTRNNVHGVFIETPETQDLRSKNFWRIVSETNLEQWKKTHDYNLCRVFNGAEFTKLSID